MITDLQKKFLLDSNPQDDRRKWNIYMSRIQDRIEHMIENTIWLAEEYPEILTDRESEFENLDLPRHRRLKQLMKVIKLISAEEGVKFLIELERE